MLSSQAPNSKHIILHAPPFWGHNKSLIALAVLIARARPTAILSLITTQALYTKSIGELEKKLEKVEFELQKAQVNIIDITGPNPCADDIPIRFACVYRALYSQCEQGLTCMSSGKIFTQLPRPVVAIIDPYAGYAYDTIRNISQDKVPIISWLSAPATFLFHHIGPKKLGGHAPEGWETVEGRKEVKSLLSRKADQGDSPDVQIEPHTKLLPSLHQSNGSEQIMVPGAPPMFVHELIPQIRFSATGKLIVVGGVYIREGNGIIMASNSAYEGETIPAIKNWFREIGQIPYVMGPLGLALPKKPGEEQMGIAEDEKEEVFHFLERIKGKFGPRSLIYISFGTFAYPPEPEKLEVLIETLIDNQIPFFFSHPSPQATLGGLRAIIRGSKIGMEMQWSPQERILQHEVTGWFITHGGWNSIQEGFQYKVPMIFWPISADQPLNAAQSVITHKAAFELIEIRSGEQGTKPLLRFRDIPGMGYGEGDYKPTFTVDAVKKEVKELLKMMKGKEGREICTNFEALCVNMRKSWDEGGECKMDFNQFLQKFVDGL